MNQKPLRKPNLRKTKTQTALSVFVLALFVVAAGALAYYGGLFDRYGSSDTRNQSSPPPVAANTGAPAVAAPDIPYDAPIPQVTSGPGEDQFNAECVFPDGRIVAGRVNVARGQNPARVEVIEVRVPGMGMRVSQKKARCSFKPVL